jgi:hypothetical protein
VYLPRSLKTIQIIVRTWSIYGLILFIIFSPFLWGDAVGKFLMPISFLLLFSPLLNTKWKIFVFSFTFYAIFFDVTARSNFIKFVVPLFLGFLYYFKNYLSFKILNIIRLILLSIPFILFLLGATDIFNLFKLDKYFGEQTLKNKTISGDEVEENLIVDNRNLLYIEVIESAIKNNYIIFGRTPARGYDSNSFGDYNKEKLKTGKRERFSNEVSILNIFTWLGIIGVILYFIIFLKASYFAIIESNNIFIKIVGLNISFRWAFGFVEDFSNFDLSNIFLWLMIGMCFSKTFRQMSNSQIKNWVLSVFILKKS